MDRTALILALGIALFSSCKPGKNGPDLHSQANSGLIPIGEHHLIFLPTAKAPTSLFILDRGEAAFPDVDTQGPIEHSEVEHEDQDLVLVGGGKAMIRFSVRTEAGSERGEIVVPVIGISRLDDPSGFDEQVLRSGTDPDAFRLARKARRTEAGQKTGGPTHPPLDNCCSGGPGSTSCSTKGETYSCSVTCTTGYYACCDRTGLECNCKRN